MIPSNCSIQFSLEGEERYVLLHLLSVFFDTAVMPPPLTFILVFEFLYYATSIVQDMGYWLPRLLKS